MASRSGFSAPCLFNVHLEETYMVGLLFVVVFQVVVQGCGASFLKQVFNITSLRRPSAKPSPYSLLNVATLALPCLRSIRPLLSRCSAPST